MTSVPNQSLSTPARKHRHRRSAAVSGDLDAMGLGLFQRDDKLSSSPDATYVFNNEEDFRGSTDFSFPAKTPDLGKKKPVFPAPPNTLSPRKILHSSSHSLHSPIRISQHKRSYTLNPSKSRFFEEQNDVPEAVIDLDEILNANLHIGSYSRNSSLGSLRPEEDDFLASPFVKSAPSSPFFSPMQHSSAPSSLGAHFLFNQPIQESNMIEEEEEKDHKDYDYKGFSEKDYPKSDLMRDYKEVSSPFSQPMYTLSANSSCSSIRSLKNSVIEKTLSNSSKESASGTPSIVIGTSTPTAKRSGAKANRYQSFYDQSSRISNAMKISSSESVNIIRSNSSKAISDRSLGHSSSLPSLKANKRLAYQRQRITEVMRNREKEEKEKREIEGQKEKERNVIKIENERAEEKCLPQKLPQPSQESDSNSSKSPTSSKSPDSVSKSKNSHVHHVSGVLTPTTTHAKGALSTSPVSLHSDISSALISSNETIQSTDHSSLTSQHDVIGKVHKVASLDKNRCMTPSIIVNGYDGSSSPSTSSTFKQEEDDRNATLDEEYKEAAKSPTTFERPAEVLSSASSTSSKSPKKGRRPTPAEENILKLTKIPSFKMENSKDKVRYKDKLSTLSAKSSGHDGKGSPKIRSPRMGGNTVESPVESPTLAFHSPLSPPKINVEGESTEYQEKPSSVEDILSGIDQRPTGVHHREMLSPMISPSQVDDVSKVYPVDSPLAGPKQASSNLSQSSSTNETSYKKNQGLFSQRFLDDKDCSFERADFEKTDCSSERYNVTGEVKQRRYSTFSLFGRHENKERRGSSSYSIASQPLNSNTTSSLRIFRNGRKHFTISSDGLKKEEKPKTARIVNWFRKR